MPSSTDLEILAGLLLEVAGKGTTRLPQARTHARVLDAAMPMMTKAQKQIARERIIRAETKWGPLLPGGSEIDCTAAENWPVHLIGRWLSKRKFPERIWPVLRRSAARVMEGNGPSLMEVYEEGFRGEVDRVVHTVGRDSFGEWLIELRIGVPVKENRKVRWYPGVLAQKIGESEPALVAACLGEAQKLKRGKQS